MGKYLARFALFLALALIALAVAVVAIVFLCKALYIALLGVASAPVAALATGLVTLLGAVLIVLAGVFATRRPITAAKGHSSPTDAAGLAGELGGLLGEELSSFARTHLRGTMMASLAAGFAVGASPELRRYLAERLKI